MITGFSIKQVCKKLGKDGATNIIKHLKPFLEKQGFETNYKKVRNYKDIPNNSIVFIEYQGEGFMGHFVVKTSKGYYDPAVGVVLKYNEEGRLPHSFLNFKKKK